jgi:hypothetical protein
MVGTAAYVKDDVVADEPPLLVTTTFDEPEAAPATTEHVKLFTLDTFTLAHDAPPTVTLAPG